MTNQTLVPRAHFVANGVQTAFGFSFPVFETGDMEVWVDQTLQPSGAYSVSGVGVPVGGTVIFTVPPPAASQVTLRRRMTLNRAPEFPDTAVQAKPLNEEFGYHTAALQQISDEAALAVKRSFRSLSNADLTLPEPSAGRALRWNDAGDGLANSAVEVDTVLPLASAKAEEAALSAASAAASRTSAASSAAQAATARDVCDADVVVTGADRAAVAADRTDVAADRAAVQADRIAADAAAASATLSQGAAQASEAAAIQAAADAAGAATSATADTAAAQAAAGAAAASQAAAQASELSALGSASAAAASAAQAQAVAGAHTFAAIAVAGQGTISADQPGDALTLAAGANLAITTDPAGDTVTLAVTGLANVATSGAYADLSGRPSLGTAAALDAAAGSGGLLRTDGDGSGLTALSAAALSSGVVAAARLGSGTASGATYLRGDGVWASLSVAPFANSQTFTTSGTFTVPAGVTMLAVMVVGGGGGGGSMNGTTGGTGGASSFGSFLSATGGTGGHGYDSSSGYGGYGSINSLGVIGALTSGESTNGDGIVASPYGVPGSGNRSRGGYGGSAFGICPVTPGQAISVTIGAGGSGGGDPPPGQPGVVIVRY